MEGGGSKARQRSKDQALAAWLKAHGVERTSGACPWGCGRYVSNGGPALLAHLTTCIGSPRHDKRRR